MSSETPTRREAADTAAAIEQMLKRFEVLCGPLESEQAGREVVTQQQLEHILSIPLSPIPREQLPTRQCIAAARLLPVDAVGISLVLDRDQRVPLGAGTPEAAVAESVEFTLGAGPCLQAQADGKPVLVPDLEDRESSQVWQRWPEYAVQMGLRTPFRAVFGFPLAATGLSLGAVSLYRRAAGPLSVSELGAALAIVDRIFDDLVATGMFGLNVEPAFRWPGIASVRTRGMVWQAIGVAVTELAVSVPEGLAMLRAYCQQHSRLLDDVAADVISRRLLLSDLS